MAGSAMAAAMAVRSLGGAMCRLSAPLRCLDCTVRSSARSRVGSGVGSGRLVNAKGVLRRTPCGCDFTPVDSPRDQHLRWLSTNATSAAGEGGAGGDASGEGATPGYREKERELSEKLQQALTADKVVVEDASGGCGTMYNIYVMSSLFAGKSLMQQHRMVTEALEADVRNWHGLTVRTAVPSSE